MAFCWILNVYVIATVVNSNDFTSELPVKYIEVANVNGLNFEDRAAIFEPTTFISSSKTAQHNVHIFDQFGKFIKLKYNSAHGDHINVFELKENFKNNIKSVQCVNNQQNTMKIIFNTPDAANKYHEDIQNHINSDEDHEYFVTGSAAWKCYNKKEKQYTPILRKIVSSELNDSHPDLLILRTKYSKYTDLFQSLEMKLETNANMRQNDKPHTTMTNAKQRRKLLCAKNNNRGLLCDEDTPSGTSLWDYIVNGITQLFSAISSLIDSMKAFIETVEDIYKGASELIDALGDDYYWAYETSTVSWQYNYDEYYDRADRLLDLSSGLTCKNCYAYADLTYYLYIIIDGYNLEYFWLSGSGTMKLNIDIEASEKVDDEFSVKTCGNDVPGLSFSIAGIHFGFSIYGEFAIGIKIDMPVKYSFNAEGSVGRGIEYNATTNTQNYLKYQSFNQDSEGPILAFEATSISVYARATLYLVLSLVGDVYFGVMPQAIISLSECSNYGSGTDCAVHYTPSVTVNIFVGAEVKLANVYSVWSLETNIETYTLSGDNSGCVTYEEISELEEWADEENCWFFCRRRMLAYDSSTRFIVNYTSPTIAHDFRYQWGQNNTIWSANLTTLNKTCYDWYHLQYDVDAIPFEAALPSYGHLIVYPQSNNGSTLYGIYKTINPISTSDGYLITTDVTCLSRYILTQVVDHDSSSTTIHQKFNVSLVDNDYHCDVNESVFLANDNLKIDEWHIQTQLPKQMDAILMDSSFGTIMLTDMDNCHIFPLTKNKALHQFSYSKNVTYFVDKLVEGKKQNISYKLPSKTWFGSFHCDYNDEVDDHLHFSDAMTLYFNYVDWINGDLNATLLINENQTCLAVGNVNYNDLTLDFTVYNSNNGKFVLNMYGFITILEDGSLLYFGVIPSDIHKCTGFIFQGAVNMEQFEESNTELIVDTECNNNTDDYALIAVQFTFIGLVIAAFLLFAFYVLVKCSGYSLSISKLNPKPNSYQLMDDL